MQVTSLLNEVEFIFAPLVNPDGYEVSAVAASIILSRTRSIKTS